MNYVIHFTNEFSALKQLHNWSLTALPWGVTNFYEGSCLFIGDIKLYQEGLKYINSRGPKTTVFPRDSAHGRLTGGSFFSYIPGMDK